MESEETAIGCCPSGYQCAQDAELQTCTTTVQSGGSVPVVTCSNGYSENFSELTIPAIATLATTSISTSSVPTITPASTPTATRTSSIHTISEFAVSEFVVFAPMIEIRWQSSDMPPFVATHTQQDSNSTTSTGASPAHGSSGLSTGSIIAISVVVPVVVIAALLVVFLWRRRARKHESSKLSGPSSTTMSGQSGTQYLMRSPGELNGLRSPQEASLPSPQERDLSWSQEGVLVSPQELDSVPPQELAGIKIERYDDE